ncbi:putative enoyl-CoA isomerase/hydratase Fer4p [[Candida] jaroonii]|uniref:Enoyl-CoA isomerase/hydratase Fer4p n=1 Tax=[Candida] jaroonii TaxID=467808 RepID=A0ACA9YGN6_9ASCO|nr:putative enoyl-CoA isomerase/hydratase Fer4p [[Candida] jaroonii]
MFDESKYQDPEFLVKEIEQGFINLQFNNPKTLNAFSERTWRAYQNILERLDADPETNIILISSSYAKSFSSGLNLKDAQVLMGGLKGDDQSKYDFMYKHIIDFQTAISTPTRMTTPTICLLNGISLGLAIDIAATTSIRVAVKDAKLSIREIKIGLVADMGSLQRLPKIVGNKSRLFQYALTGEYFNGDDAYDIGLVSKVVPDYESGMKYCIELGKDINSNADWVIRGTKDSLQYMVNGGTVDQGLLNIAHYQSRFLGAEPKIPSRPRL